MSLFSRLFSCCVSSSKAAPEQDYALHRAADDVLIDVRTPAEYKAGHLKGATNVNVMSSDFNNRIDRLSLDKSRPVYVYCRSGSRSGRAAQILRSRGFSNVQNVGGYNALVAAGIPSARG